MKRLIILMSVLALLVLAMGTAALAADSPKAGCSNCHTGNYALGNEIKNVKGHPAVAATANYDTCVKCHKATGPMAFAPILHKAHYEKGKESHFVTNYGGLCQNCHIADVKTGDFSGILK